MRRAWLAAPVLLALTGCASLDPAAALRAAARNLNFRLEAVRPRLDIAFPLERSALVIAVDLGVDNGSNLRLAARALGGRIQLDSAGSSFPLGQLNFPAGVTLDPVSRRTVRAELRLPYGEVRNAWKVLESVALKGGAGTWTLDGAVTFDILGVPLQLPLRTHLQTGTPRP